MREEIRRNSGFNFLKRHEEKFAAVNFSAVIETDQIGLAGGSRHTGDLVDEIAG